MLTDNQLTRLADAAAALRPDWQARSVRAYLASKFRDRTFQDVATALAVVATDPGTDTPARLELQGPWWTATRALSGWRGASTDPGPGRGASGCPRPGHNYEPANACRWCRAEELAGDDHEEPGPLLAAGTQIRRKPRPISSPA